jgi:high-affinity nickel-transport protein
MLIRVSDQFPRHQRHRHQAWLIKFADDNPIRKLWWYNRTIMAVSAVLGLVDEKFRLEGDFWKAIADLNKSMGNFGFLVIGVFLICWVVSALICRWNSWWQRIR